ncbi:hypothetical protein [Nocardia heshunensis]
MAIQVVSEWLITSDLVSEVAFRIDVPEPDRGRWMLSYLPTKRRLTREQALVGVRLAELLLCESVCENSESDLLVARLHAEELDMDLSDAMCLLALRAIEYSGDETGPLNSRAREAVR